MGKINIRNIIGHTINEEIGLLNEASFSQSGLRKVSDLLAIVLGRDLGGEFKLLGAGLGKETFKKKKFGEGQGFRFMGTRHRRCLEQTNYHGKISRLDEYCRCSSRS